MSPGYEIGYCKIFNHTNFIAVENWHTLNKVHHDSYTYYPYGLKGVHGIVGIWKLKTKKHDTFTRRF